MIKLEVCWSAPKHTTIMLIAITSSWATNPQNVICWTIFRVYSWNKQQCKISGIPKIFSECSAVFYQSD